MSLKKILSCLVRADFDYNLIENKDYIAVGVSGGKDSMLLLKALKQYQMYPFKDFSFTAVFLDLGFGNVDTDTLKQFCSDNDITLHIEDSTEVYKILSQHKNNNGNLSCSICSRMKKAAINKVAHQLNCNKVAFAHHLDDALETLLMNEIYGGRLATFAPKMFLSDTKLTFIRPFCLVREKDIISTTKSENIPIIKSACPNDHHTMREDAKEMLNYIYKKYPESFNNFRNMLTDYSHFDLWFDKKSFPIENNFTIKECISKDDFLVFFNIYQEVFINELHCAKEFLVNNELNYHFYLLSFKDKGIGIISYLQEDDKLFKIDNFAILKEFRSKNLGSKLLRYVECEISTNYNPCFIYAFIPNYLKELFINMDYHIDNISDDSLKMSKPLLKGLKYRIYNN